MNENVEKEDDDVSGNGCAVVHEEHDGETN